MFYLRKSERLGVNEERREGSGSSQSGAGGGGRGGDCVVFLGWTLNSPTQHFITYVLSHGYEYVSANMRGPPAGIPSMGLAILLVARISSASYESLGLLNLTLP